MSKGTKICKICGVEYPYCKTERSVDIFRWQDVACCIEHGEEYFKLIEESRRTVTEDNKKISSNIAPAEQPKRSTTRRKRTQTAKSAVVEK